MVLAYGTINGEIHVWKPDDRDANSEMVLKSEADEYFHREPIRKVLWINVPSEYIGGELVSLVSVSSDGKVLIWKNPERQLRYPIKGHIFARTDSTGLKMLAGCSMD